MSFNLMWQDAQRGITKASWSEAKRYCENLNYAGYSNWKLPSLEQMLSIIDRSRREPAINPAFKYTNSKQYWYHTSTKDAKGSSNLWSVHFVSGVVRNDSGVPSIRSVRCVMAVQ